jgi:hypothetical protein
MTHRPDAPPALLHNMSAAPTAAIAHAAGDRFLQPNLAAIRRRRVVLLLPPDWRKDP